MYSDYIDKIEKQVERDILTIRYLQIRLEHAVSIEKRQIKERIRKYAKQVKVTKDYIERLKKQ